MDTIVTMTNRGVITLPKLLRTKLGLKDQEQFQVELTPQGILLRPVVMVPVELYSEERLNEFAASEDQLRRKMK